MKGFISKAGVALAWVAGAALGAAWAGGPGADHGDHDYNPPAPTGCWYHELVDPCYPERYEYMARQETLAGFAAQVQNGHVLDQTLWNFYFEAGSDRLTPGGLAHLQYLARRRPCPDTTVFLQTALDVAYDPAAPDRMIVARQDLDQRRIQAIQSYLVAQTAGRGGIHFEVVVHDPAEVGLSAIPVNQAVQQMYAGFRGSIRGGAGGGTVTGGAGVGR